MIQSRLLSFLALSLAGCAVAMAPSDGPRPNSNGHRGSAPVETVTGPGSSGREDGQTAPGTASPTGTLLIAVRWPARPPGFGVQVIPLSVNSMRLRVLAAAGGETVASAFLTRPVSGNPESTVSIEVPGGTGYQVEVKAFRLMSPPADATPVAQGLATDVAISPSTQTEVALTLVPANPPSFTGFTPSNGGPGLPVTLAGTNLDQGVPGVRFGSEAEAVVSASSGTSLVAIVPASALTGQISVVVDGVTATSSSSFVVLQSLELSPAATSDVPVGTNLGLALNATDTGGNLVSSPSVTLSFLPILAPGEDDDGYFATMSGLVFTPNSTGTWVVTAQSGILTGTATVDVE